MNKYELALVVSANVEDEVRNATVEQVKEFLEEVINPILEENKEILGMKAEINVQEDMPTTYQVLAKNLQLTRLPAFRKMKVQTFQFFYTPS